MEDAITLILDMEIVSNHLSDLVPRSLCWPGLLVSALVVRSLCWPGLLVSALVVRSLCWPGLLVSALVVRSLCWPGLLVSALVVRSLCWPGLLVSALVVRSLCWPGLLVSALVVSLEHSSCPSADHGGELGRRHARSGALSTALQSACVPHWFRVGGGIIDRSELLGKLEKCEQLLLYR